MPKTITITDIPDEFYAATVEALCLRGNCQSEDAAERDAFAQQQLLTEIGSIVAEHAREQAQQQAADVVATAEAQVVAAHAAIRQQVSLTVQTQI